MKQSVAFLAVLLAAIVSSAQESESEICTELESGNTACCTVGESKKDVGKGTLLVSKSEDPFTDAAVYRIAAIDGKRLVILQHSGEVYNVIWMFTDTEPAVFIIDDEHRKLPGVVRFGKLEAREAVWAVLTKKHIQAAISLEEFQAARNGVALKVSNTWMQPQYQAVLDFSCKPAWEFIADATK